MSERVARLRIELQELEPKIWRRIDMPLSTALEALHEAIQMTMGWTFSYLWEFDIDGRCYGDLSFREFDDEPPIYKAKGLRQRVVISRGVDRFVYTYDYGDNWRHDVIVEEVRDGDPDREYPAFVDGARRCPPEDVGGPHGVHGLPGGGPQSGARATPGHGPLVRRAVRPDRLRRGACAFLHGEHGAPAARPAGQSQERIAASETMTVAPGMAGRIDAAFSAQNCQVTPKALRNGPEFEKICIRFDDGF